MDTNSLLGGSLKKNPSIVNDLVVNVGDTHMEYNIREVMDDSLLLQMPRLQFSSV